MAEFKVCSPDVTYTERHIQARYTYQVNRPQADTVC